MSKAPPVPPEQRALDGDKRSVKGQRPGDVESPAPGDADANLEEHGRFGNIRQNTTHQGGRQDR